MQKIMIAAIVATVGSASGQNLLANQGFEAQINFDGNPIGNWSAFFGGADFQMAESIMPGMTDGPAAEGAQVLQIGTFNTPNTFVGVSQNVPVSEGVEYIFEFEARQVISNGALAEYRIEWFDAGGAVIGDQFGLTTPFAPAVSMSFESFDLSALAPAGAANANVVIALQTFGGVAPHEAFIQIDDASFSVVPAPASAALLGLGGLAAARRRRA